MNFDEDYYAIHQISRYGKKIIAIGYQVEDFTGPLQQYIKKGVA